jgi:hypothetical protein
VLEVIGGPETFLDQVKIQQNTTVGASQTNQLFRLIKEGDGNYMIRAQNSGNLSDCLANVTDGDNLVIVPHGFNNVFEWLPDSKSAYTGFGPGANQGKHPALIPASFSRLNKVNALMASCFSAASGENGEASLAYGLYTAMGVNKGNVAKGYSACATAGVIATVSPGTGTDDDAVAALKELNNITTWKSQR